MSFQNYVLLFATKIEEYTSDLRQLITEETLDFVPNLNSKELERILEVYGLLSKYNLEYFTFRQMKKIAPAIRDQIIVFRMAYEATKDESIP